MKCLRPRPEPQEKECPKCGNEMRYFDRFAAWRHKEPVYGPGPDDYGRIRYYRCVKCGHESASWEEFPDGEKK
jgi:Zn ribbon nucleic-acid-binding protein